MAKLSEADKLGMSPEEIAVLESPEAADEVIDAGETDATETAGEAGAAETAETAGGAAEATAEQGEPAVTSEPDAKPSEYRVADKDFDAEIKDVRSKLRQAHDDWDAGKIDDDAYRAQVDELETQREALLVEKTRKDTIAEINEQNKQRAFEEHKAREQAAMRGLALKVKATIDYAADAVAAKQFDVHYAALLADPENRAKPVAEVVEAAHRAVLATRGIVDKPAEKVEKTQEKKHVEAPKAAPRTGVPQTIGDIPTAGRQQTGGDPVFDKFMSLSGEEAEIFLASQPKTVVEALLRKVDALAG